MTDMVDDKPNVPASEPEPSNGADADRFHCDQCDRTFNSKQGLSMHKTRSHKRGGRLPRAQTPLPRVQTLVDSTVGPMFEPNDDEMAEFAFKRATEQYLPVLARELERRKLVVGYDDTMNSVFLTLYLDSLS